MGHSSPSTLAVVALVGAAVVCVALYRLLGVKKATGVLSVVILVFLAWVSWKFQPWMPTGRSVQVSRSHLGKYDFQVWQRKNDSVTEPFTTWLFARNQGGQWRLFMLDFEDTYRPTISIRKEGSRTVVLYGRTSWGYFDEGQGVLVRESSDASLPIEGAVIDSDPPGNW